jgi:hypothetical protein
MYDLITQSINRHAALTASPANARQAVLLLVVLAGGDVDVAVLAHAQVRLEALVEVVRAPDRVDDGGHQHGHGDDGEDGERAARRQVVLHPRCVGAVHAEEFEEEVGEGTEVEDL